MEMGWHCSHLGGKGLIAGCTFTSPQNHFNHLGQSSAGVGGCDRRTKLGSPAISLTAPLSPRWGTAAVAPRPWAWKSDDDAATSADTIVIAAHDRKSPAPQIRKPMEKAGQRSWEPSLQHAEPKPPKHFAGRPDSTGGNIHHSCRFV
jgi:hypothetical protein